MKLSGLKFSTAIVAVVGCLLVVGCKQSGPELVRVEGTVTMDGKPLANASIEFAPAPGTNATTSYGVTDSNGHYVMEFSDTRSGVMPGKYIVRISTEQVDEETGSIKQKETVPAKYNVNSELVVEVKPGGGPYDFQLDSKGKIVTDAETEGDDS